MSTNPLIDAYIERSAQFAQPILRRLRKLVHAGCPDAVESIKWSHVSFGYREQIFCSLAAFRAHVAFGFWHQQMKKVLAKDGFKGGDAMGLMGRITSLADLPDDKTMLRYIKAARALHDSGSRVRPRPKPLPALATPAFLTAALKRDQAAAAAWERFSPSHRREYVEWLTEAKQDATRARRLATTLEWLAAGKPRNWKYMNC